MGGGGNNLHIFGNKKKIFEEKIMPRLHEEAEKRTWEFLQNLVEQGKISDIALKNAKLRQTKYPDFSFRTHQKHDMYYYYVDDELIVPPYQVLFVNRLKENGKRVARMPLSHTFGTTVKADQEYLELKEKLERSDEIEFDRSSYDYDEAAIFSLAKEIAKQQNFEHLTLGDLEKCIQEVLYVKTMSKCFDEAREFCFLLVSQNAQEELEANEEEFVSLMNRKYKFCASFENLSDFMMVVDVILGRIRKRKMSKTNKSMPEPDAHQMIDVHLEAKKKMYLGSTNRRSVYIKLKLAVAEEIGLITKNEKTGYYEEMYGDFVDKMVEELRLESAD